MAGFSYTRADLAARVLARLSEVGVASATVAGSVFAAPPYTQAQVIDRALARLNEIGFDLGANAGVAGYTQDQVVDRVLAKLGETGFDLATGVIEPSIDLSFNDLVERALIRLGEVGFGQTPEAEALVRMTDLAPQILAELVKNRIYLPITEPIPAEAFDALATILASRSSSDFGLGTDEIALLAQRAQAAQDVLKRFVFEYQKRATDATRIILSELAANRLLNYPAGGVLAPHISDAATTIIAARLAGEFGLSADRQQVLAAQAAAATGTLRRLAYNYQKRVTVAFPGILAELTNAQTYAFPADGSIPAEAADSLADILAARLSGDFELDPARTQQIVAEGQAAQRRLVLLGLPVRVANAIPAILAELYTDKVYAFPVDDQIRADAFDGLAAICSARLAADIAPERAPLLLQDAQMAEMRLRRMRSQSEPSRPVYVDYF